MQPKGTLPRNGVKSAPGGGTQSWIPIAAVLLAGIIAALQVGKAPIALPALRADLNLTLVMTGWLVAIFSLLTGLCGLFSGMTVDRLGYRRTLASGLAIITFAGAWGATSSGIAELLASRMIEGIGFLLVCTSAPRFIIALVSGPQQRLVLGLWSTYMPTGIILMLVLGPYLLEPYGWRGLWWAGSALAALMWLLILGLTPPARPGQERGGRLKDLKIVLMSPGPLLLAACFAGFAFQHLALISFLPTLLVEQHNHSIGHAAVLTSWVVAANIIGGISAGWLLARGISRATLIGGASLVLAVAALGMMSEGLPGELRYICAVAISGFGGLIPGAIFSGIPLHTPGSHRTGSVSGLVVQGSQAGQFLGPTVVSWLVAWSGNWNHAGWALIAAAALTATMAVPLGILERRHGSLSACQFQ
ncbi:CynX/NimT family MFS transporter [Marinobacter sp.]|uniref:MFS transporter n=1 Tax=Marinobacter sp. TaxID=50741 RepID=UPI00384FA1F3